MTRLVFWRDPETGIVFSEYENPVGAWTPEEWQAELESLRAELAQVEAMLSSLEPPKDWPEDAKQMWLNYHTDEFARLSAAKDDLTYKLSVMEAVGRG
ncbi:MAG: mediator of RNA polymerase II transcription subunit 9 [Dehalococcoidia bacterium]|nr:mediator of RNA polymerase II transcription subunit 9 [Dehalococcoidia bacterium]